ncbi:MAG: tyrosine-type recombinase/integrase [Ignavibacteriaceae bacterium]
MKVKFYLDSKSTKSGEAAIWCYVREYDKTLALNTGERIKTELWDKESQRANLRKTKEMIVKGSLKNLNQYLNTFEGKILDITRTLRSKDFKTGFSSIADEIKKQFDNRETSIFSVYDEFISIKRHEVSKQSLLKFKRIKDLLQEYQIENREKLDFNKITPLFFSKFNSFLIDNKNMLNNTASKNIQFLKSFLIWANNNNYSDNNSYKSFKSKSEKNEVIYLTEDELMTLYNFVTNDEKLKRVRDLFVFQCFTGVRYSDIQNISREDINNATWTVRTQKTHQIIEIPLNSYAISILAKYSDYPQPLPVISNQKMNDYLKELCEEAGIIDSVKTVKYKGTERIETTYKKFEVVGTHTARRTFISLSLQKGMKPDVIMAITGHTTYRMMQKYLKIADEHKREEMDKAWGKSLRVV